MDHQQCELKELSNCQIGKTARVAVIDENGNPLLKLTILRSLQSAAKSGELYQMLGKYDYHKSASWNSETTKTS